ncbi:IS5 family transposase [Thalassomonas actiniarum]|uniref:IS5 family transposase n=1 Tax=Thalassomonas actiniarum TaxID=485447 RepID=A0AAE9YSQ6_9GAMM|nr:IS5 family transposase [Thalassomonas actiniarum]WDE00536.1 IS5 family transposase [Thalassomonas actiniarum]
MPRLMLTDETWNLLSRIMLLTGRIYSKPEHRMTMEGILFRLRTGIPWRDLPPEFGGWSKVFRRFNLWSQKGVLVEVFTFLSKLHDSEWLFIDGSIVKAHQDSTNTADASAQAVGKSRGGNTTKIHLAVDSGGLPVHFELSEGQVNDIVHAESLISASPESEMVVADKGYDSEALREFVRQKNAKPVIPRRDHNEQGNEDIDWCMYRYRHLVENAFMKINKYRAISTRYDKLARNYQAMVALAFSFM